MDYFSESRKMAAQFREIYEAFISVGFSEDEAMRMILALMATPVVR